jgi:hypothetical protein
MAQLDVNNKLAAKKRNGLKRVGWEFKHLSTGKTNLRGPSLR